MRRLSVTAVAWVVVWGGVSLHAGQPKAQPKPKAQAPPPRQAPNRPNRPQQPPQSPTREVERFLNMPADQREKELSKLPPARRERVEQQVDRLNKMPPAQRAQELRRLQAFEDLPPQRRVVVRQQIQSLQALPRPERQAWLNSDEMKRNFSPAEQQILRERFGQQQLH
jgi:hypothetical protein